jgi:hypothetical protein
VALDEHVEVDGIEVAPLGVRQPGHIAERDRGGCPLHIPATLLLASNLALPACDLAKPPEALAR